MVGEVRLLEAYPFLTPEAVFIYARDDAGSYGDAILAAVTHHAAAHKAMLTLKQVVMRQNKRRVLEVVEAGSKYIEGAVMRKDTGLTILSDAEARERAPNAHLAHLPTV